MNAADRGQVVLTKRQEQDRAEQFRSDLKSMLALPAGRRVLWSILRELEPHGQMWAPNAAIVGFNAARYDVALALRESIDDADPDAWLKMLGEARMRQKQEEREREARQVNSKKYQSADNENDSAFGESD